MNIRPKILCFRVIEVQKQHNVFFTLLQLLGSIKIQTYGKCSKCPPLVYRHAFIPRIIDRHSLSNIQRMVPCRTKYFHITRWMLRRPTQLKR